ncbi:MAG: TonB-dependent receptor [Bacteroidales bacterium]|jgi:outer membrane receptor for ferrienterochelin and colicins|nr:TonB-dependent receptor [Bacteroidales bacterium]
MKITNLYLSILLVFILISFNSNAQRTDANIIGHVTDIYGEHIPFATIILKKTTIGAATEETGHFNMINMPVGKFTVKASAIGFKPFEKEIELTEDKTIELNFILEADVLGLEQVVITADRNDKHRQDASVIVNTITPKLFEIAQAVNIGDGLNFCPGLRMENNCQNCGFNQVRMNGLDGPYSQILINSRPIFSGLAGVYGLELIPSSMIERIEVVRGGGSSLYGSNAIAGTVNLILKDPINNSYEASVTSGYTGVGLEGSGNPALDYSLNFNTSIVSHDSKTGMALYGFNRNQDPFDANNDGFSEVAEINNTTIGTRLFHRFGYRNKIAVDFFTINEERRGGNKFGLPKHEADIAEAVDHKITTGAVTFDQFFRDEDKLSVFVSGQFVDRDSYYGALQTLHDYGKTVGLTTNLGVQYNVKFTNSSLLGGLEYRGETLEDKKLGYPDYENAEFVNDTLVIPHIVNTIVAEQISNIYGAFAQYDIDFNAVSISIGARFDHYNIENKANNSSKFGNVLSPRLTVKYDLLKSMQARFSYSQGYRAPQIFDEDLHIETSGSRKVIHENNPDLKQESSHSFMASFDFNKLIGKMNTGFLIEGFYTQLNDAFANTQSFHPTEQDVIIYTRINVENGAIVKGVNFELNLIPSGDFYFSGGFTFQKNEYQDPQDEFSEKSFFRSPNMYGYTTINWDFIKDFSFSATGNYTGRMLVPYYGTELPNGVSGELRESDSFMDLGAKLSYQFRLNGASMQLFVGIKNMFNSYQDDFDSGINRDPGYMYGPSLPRTVYFGLKIGNLLQ